MRIAILGAPATGKTRLADDLARHLQDALITDSPPLMTAIGRGRPSGDRSLDELALEYRRNYDLTLLTGLDLPQGSGAEDGSHRRQQADALLRETLQRAGIAFFVVYGSGPERSANALRVIPQSGSQRLKKISTGRPSAWVWSCDKCSDPDCEHRLFTGLRGLKGADRPPP